MRDKKGLVAAVIVVLAIVAAVLYWQPWQQAGSDAEEATVPALPAVVRDRGTIFAEGRLSPQRQATLALESGGLVQEILVAEGQSVGSGEALARLDSRDAEIGVSQAQAALVEAEANVAAAQARLQSAEAGERVARLGIDAAEARREAITAAPQSEAVALAESAVAAANAGVAQAAGERDVTLETDEAAIAAAGARLEAAEANLFAVRVADEPVTQNPDADEDEREQAQLRLNAAIAAVEAARAELEALQGGATEAEERAASSAVAGAAQERAAAQAELDLLEVGARPEAVEVALAEVAQAQQTAAEMEAQMETARAAVAQAEAQLAAAQSELQAAEVVLERRTLRAPFGGTVVQVMVKTGEMIANGSPILIVADLEAWRVRTDDLTELDVVRLQEGQMVEIAVDAFPDETFSGEIVQIAGAATASGDDVTYEVTATLSEAPDVPLRWGMTAFITVE